MEKSGDKLTQYLHKGFRDIEGWLEDGAAMLVMKVNQIQNEQNVKGHVVEIGVHHGKLFILLSLLCKENEHALAIDLFEDFQELNVDSSGSGNKQKFLENIRNYGDYSDRIKVHVGDSTKISSDDIIKMLSGKVKLFSVDGGHTRDITFNDLKAAAGTLCDGGVIILDDCFNDQWPGVSEGFGLFMNSEYGKKFAPIFIGGNKLFITSVRDYKKYIDFLHKDGSTVCVAHNYSKFKSAELYGYEVLCFSYYRKKWPQALYQLKAFINTIR